MKKKKLASLKMEKLVNEIANTYKGETSIDFIDVSNLPVRRKILEILELLEELHEECDSKQPSATHRTSKRRMHTRK